jgi:DNA invertase Pin-like site-specific DNA recombinase
VSAPGGPPAPMGPPAPGSGDGHPPASEKNKFRAALYLRVSTSEQTTDNQELALRQIAAARGWNVVEVYNDTGISGAKGRNERPALDAMLHDASRRRFDVVMAWKLDRLGRSTLDLHNNAEHLRVSGVEIFCPGQGIDTATSAGKLTFTILAGVAEFERDLIRERVNAGIARARAKGVKLGRPKTEKKIEDQIRALLGSGVGMNKIAAQLGVGKLTVQRVKKEMVG